MKISELVQIQPGVTPQDISAAKTSPYYSMKGVGRVLAQATTAALAAGKKLTVQLMQAKDNAGTGAKVLGAAVDLVMPGGGAAFAQAEATAASMDLANGYTHVAVQISSDNGAAVNGAAILILGDRSFRP
jgi:hypothetical protein